MTDPGFDPIEVLLVDDEPSGLWENSTTIDGRPRRPGILPDPRRELPLEQLFRVRWIATPEEAREYRDLVRSIELRDPLRLGRDGSPPHILILDYLLKANSDPVATRLAGDVGLGEVSPLPRLRQLAAEDATPPDAADTFTRLPDSEANYGCFIGGLLLAQFPAHPCVPVTTTANLPSSIRGTAAEFLEWLLRRDSGGRLRAVGPRPSGWQVLLPLAVPQLRARLAELVQHRHVSVSLADLLRLAAGEGGAGLAVSSQYGVHRYPVEGLFCDHRRADIADAARQWAGALLRTVLSRDAVPEITQARQLADLLWRAGEDDALVNDRLALADLVREFRASPAQMPEAQRRFDSLWGKFSSRESNLPALARRGSRVELDRNVFDLRADLVDGCTDRVRRWAALLIFVRLIEQRHRALRKQSAPLADSGDDTGVPLCEEDIHFALFPVPATPVTLEDMTSSGAVKSLRLLDDPAGPAAADKAHGNLGLEARDLLAGHRWDPAAGHYGIHPAEAQVLEWYALELGHPRSEWDRYTRSRLEPSQGGGGTWI